MIRSRTRPSRNSRTALIAIAAVVVAVLALPWSATAAQRAPRAPAAAARTAGTTLTRTLHYHGVTLRVPSGWPVFHLDAQSRICVRFNRHAVYLGRPGTNQDCPQQAAGRTEAILVSPESYRGGLLTAAVHGADAPAGSMVRVADRAHGVVITATWGRDPALIRAALKLRSLRAAVLATDSRRPRAAPMPLRHARALPRVTSPESPATPGEVYAGLGFDVCTTPSATAMSAWGAKSPYAAIGIYIGGANAACLGGNLNASWVSTESLAGWHMIPIYVGLQAPGNGCGCQSLSTAVTNGQYVTAASQGTAAAQDAVVQAQALGIGTANPIYFDMENYKRSTTTSAAVLAFLQAWTLQLHASGYLSGVYSSGSSGITDLVNNYGTTYVEPDELWTAAWDSTAPATPPTSTANAYVPPADWPGGHQLLQYYSDAEGKAETYGGVTISIDRDYVDAPTAAYGSGTLVSQIGATPTLTIKPQANGSVNLTPQWSGAIGVTGYTILGGASPTSLAAVGSVTASAKLPLKLQGVYAYYQVQAVNSLGQVIGTSAPITAPASVAIFGNSAYVGPRGPVGIPVACLNLTPCQLEAAIYEGKRRLAHSQISGIPAGGGQLLVPMSTLIHRLVTAATGHRVPVTVTLTSATGAKATRPLKLVSYSVSGASPKRRTWPSSALQILGSTSFVSDGWTGGVLALCRSLTPCVSTASISLHGAALAEPRVQTLAPGQIGYLTYRMTPKGHALLRSAAGNQLGARVTVSTTAPSSNGAAGTVSGAKQTTALISLVTFF